MTGNPFRFQRGPLTRAAPGIIRNPQLLPR